MLLENHPSNGWFSNNKNLALINARPKKVLGYKAPADLFEQELQKVLHLIAKSVALGLTIHCHK